MLHCKGEYGIFQRFNKQSADASGKQAKNSAATNIHKEYLGLTDHGRKDKD